LLCSTTPHTTPIDLFFEFEERLTTYNVETINYLVEGIITAHTVNLAEIVNAVHYDSDPESLYKRFQRFFSKEIDMSPLGLFCLDYHLKHFVHNRKRCSNLFLLIDRHTWEFGSKVFNLLSIKFIDPYCHIEFPVVAIDLDVHGNSSTDMRIELLNDISSILAEYIKDNSITITVLGDREFIGNDWFDYIMLNFSSGIFRIKRDFKLNSFLSVSDVYEDLEAGEIFETIHNDSKIVIKRLPDCSGRRDDCLALISLDVNESSLDILEKYKMRWGIERTFFNMESNGFNLRSTHLRKRRRIEMMFHILVICYYMSSLGGFIDSQEKPKAVKNHGYKSISLFLRGRRYLMRLFSSLKFALLETKQKANYIFRALLYVFDGYQLSYTGVL